MATAESEGEWLRAAEGKTAREVEGLVAGHQRGDRPADPIDSGAKRHVLRFEVSAETLAEFRDAQARVSRDAGERLDDDAVLRLMARATQTIPPAIRRQVVRREHGRCAVPGCRCSRFLDIHHIRPRHLGSPSRQGDPASPVVEHQAKVPQDTVANRARPMWTRGIVDQDRQHVPHHELANSQVLNASDDGGAVLGAPAYPRHLRARAGNILERS